MGPVSAKVICFYSGRELGPATLGMLEYREGLRRQAERVELLRQVDAHVEAYRFAWDPTGQWDCDESLHDVDCSE